jgi:hypothetical protein
VRIGNRSEFELHLRGQLQSNEVTDPSSMPRSTWNLPIFFYKKLSHIGAKAIWEPRGQHCQVTHRGYGQEFVFEVPQSGEDRANVLSWLISFPFATTAVSASALVT